VATRPITLLTILLSAGVAIAADPVPPALPATTDSRGALVRSLLAALDLPVHLGDSWAEAQPQLYALRCLPEDSVTFAAMDCRSNLKIGPFSAAGPEGDGLTVYSDDGASVTRIEASRTTADEPRNCLSFESAVFHALAKVGVPSKLDRIQDGIRLRAGAAGDLQLVIECRPKAQTLELADAWAHLVPQGKCPDLRSAPAELRTLADSAMTGQVHGGVDELGLACNRPGFELIELAAQLMDGLMAAYATRKVEIPDAPPGWLVAQIRGGFADARTRSATLEPDSRRRFEAFIAQESTPTYLGSLWSKLQHVPQEKGPSSGDSGRSKKSGGRRSK
jgi:hypothetical protein